MQEWQENDTDDTTPFRNDMLLALRQYSFEYIRSLLDDTGFGLFDGENLLAEFSEIQVIWEYIRSIRLLSEFNLYNGNQ